MVRVHGHPHARRAQHSRCTAAVPGAGAYGADRTVRQRMVALSGWTGTGYPVFYRLVKRRHGRRRREAPYGHRAVSRAGGHPDILRPYAANAHCLYDPFTTKAWNTQVRHSLCARAGFWRGDRRDSRISVSVHTALKRRLRRWNSKRFWELFWWRLSWARPYGCVCARETNSPAIPTGRPM